jgi:hypothetical protein
MPSDEPKFLENKSELLRMFRRVFETIDLFDGRLGDIPWDGRGAVALGQMVHFVSGQAAKSGLRWDPRTMTWVPEIARDRVIGMSDPSESPAAKARAAMARRRRA